MSIYPVKIEILIMHYLFFIIFILFPSTYISAKDYSSKEFSYDDISIKFPDIPSQLLIKSKQGDPKSQFELADKLTTRNDKDAILFGLALMENSARKYRFAALTVGQ